MNLLVIFFTGLTIGGLSCMAVQGGLLASLIAQKDTLATEHNKKQTLFITIIFLTAKLISHAILGFVLGAFGNSLNISGNFQVYLQLLAGIYMILIALNLLDFHPVFRYFIIQPPKFLTKIIKNQSRSKNIFAPALLGIMTIFIPCGTTLAMEALAISTTHALEGMLIMIAFILGTTPFFLGAGLLITVLNDALKAKFLKATAIILIYLGFISIYGSTVALGLPLPFFKTNTPQVKQKVMGEKTNPETGNQTLTIKITPQGYSPNYFQVKKDSPVIIKVLNSDTYSCASAFRIPALGISKNIPPGSSEIFTFTPKETGKIYFSCSMGMYQGVIEVL